eukprot:11105834-Alexandrium_andersonii.AAC.1
MLKFGQHRSATFKFRGCPGRPGSRHEASSWPTHTNSLQLHTSRMPICVSVARECVLPEAMLRARWPA